MSVAHDPIAKKKIEWMKLRLIDEWKSAREGGKKVVKILIYACIIRTSSD